jgi:hypothetical protein
MGGSYGIREPSGFQIRDHIVGKGKCPWCVITCVLRKKKGDMTNKVQRSTDGIATIKMHTERVDELLDAHRKRISGCPGSQDHPLRRLQESEAKQLALQAIRTVDLTSRSRTKSKTKRRKRSKSQSQHGLSDFTKRCAPPSQIKPRSSNRLTGDCIPTFLVGQEA